eukprot:gene30371-34419_t
MTIIYLKQYRKVVKSSSTSEVETLDDYNRRMLKKLGISLRSHCGDYLSAFITQFYRLFGSTSTSKLKLRLWKSSKRNSVNSIKAANEPHAHACNLWSAKMAKNTGDDFRRGSVKDRSQFERPDGHSQKRNAGDGKFMQVIRQARFLVA